MRTLQLVLMALGPAVLGGSVFAATLRVPSEYATIRAAVAAADSGDEILLAPGRYTGEGNTGISVNGISLTLRSETDAITTSIDGEDTAWGFRFGLEAGDVVTIRGVELTRFYGLGGTALQVRGSGEVLIEDCRFVKCSASDYDPEGDGGTAVVVGNQVRSTIRRCVFSENTAVWYPPSGLLLAARVTSTVEDCTFDGNSHGTDVYSSDVEFQRCTFSGDGNLRLMSTSGTVDIVDCTFVNNGSGIFSQAHLTVSGSTFARTPSISVFSGSLYAESSILSDGCPGSGIEANAPVTLVCCALDSTRVSGWEHITLVGDQVWEDPLFCDPEPCQPTYFNDGAIDRYRLHSDSPCVWWRSPCGVRIGSLDVGCGAAGIGACCLEDGCFLAPQEECEAAGGMFEGEGTSCEPFPCGVTPTVPMSWGTIKQLFR